MLKGETVQYIDVISDIQGLDDAEYIACILTSWQFDVLLAYLQSHSLKNGILIVESVPFSDTLKYRLSEEQVSQYADYYDKIYFCKTRTPSYNLSNLLSFLLSKKIGEPIIFLRPRPNISLRLLSVISNPKRKIRFVALDEGISSYYSLFDSLYLIYGRKVIAIWKWLIQILLNGIGRLFISEKESFGLFEKESGGLSPNGKTCEALKQLYENRVCLSEGSTPTILFFKDYKVVPDEFSLSIIDKIVGMLENQDVQITIKKHPSDTDTAFDNTIKKYSNVLVMQSLQSGEELVAKIKPILIIGGYSTVIFSSSLIFQTPAISYSPMYIRRNMIGKELKKNIELFTKQLKQCICFCDSYEMIEQNMKSKIKK